MTIRDRVEQMLRQRPCTARDLALACLTTERVIHAALGDIRDYCEVRSAQVRRVRRRGDRGRDWLRYWIEAD